MRRYMYVRDAVKKNMTKAVRYILRGKIWLVRGGHAKRITEEV